MSRVLAGVLLVAAVALAGCGAHHPSVATRTAKVRVGMTRADVRRVAGTPRHEGPRCWLYRWVPQAGSAEDGRRICFADGRVARIQIAVHG
jgi:hypothetical protein